jgi:hypothetical protein
MKQLVSYKNGKNVSVPEVNIKNNMLTAKCKVDSLAVFNHYSKHFKTKVEYRDRKVVETKYINQLTAWQKFQTKVFWPITILLMLIGFFVISKIIR